MLPPSMAHKTTTETPYNFFDQQSEVARSMIGILLLEAKIASNGEDALSRLATFTQNPDIAFGQVDYEADLNLLAALQVTVRDLPTYL